MKKILNNLKIRNPETGKFESVPGVIGESAGINYSTEEVLTGDTWIDGKPIYRKTFSYDTFTASADFATDLLRSEIAAIISVDGFACVRNYPSTSQADYYFPINMYNTDQTFIGAYLYSDTTVDSTLKLRINKGSGYGNMTSVSITVYYTKTAD